LRTNCDEDTRGQNYEREDTALSHVTLKIKVYCKLLVEIALIYISIFICSCLAYKTRQSKIPVFVVANDEFN